MEIMGVIGVIVNCALIGETRHEADKRYVMAIPPGLSGPVHRMFPNMTGGQQVVLIIALEHAMLLLKVVLSNLPLSITYHCCAVPHLRGHPRHPGGGGAGAGADGVQEAGGGEAGHHAAPAGALQQPGGGG